MIHVRHDGDHHHGEDYIDDNDPADEGQVSGIKNAQITWQR